MVDVAAVVGVRVAVVRSVCAVGVTVHLSITDHIPDRVLGMRSVMPYTIGRAAMTVRSSQLDHESLCICTRFVVAGTGVRAMRPPDSATNAVRGQCNTSGQCIAAVLHTARVVR